MSNDLEKFLKQAAERLAQKSNANRGGTARPAAKPKPTSQPSTSRSAPQPPRSGGSQADPRSGRSDRIIEAEVVNVSPSADRRMRELGPDPLSAIDTRPALAQEIDQADERMGEHVHQVFDHELSHMRPASASLAGNRPTTGSVVNAPIIDNPVMQLIRSPESLRAAFIASEIFKRKS